jgi:hypothetical protein
MTAKKTPADAAPKKKRKAAKKRLVKTPLDAAINKAIAADATAKRATAKAKQAKAELKALKAGKDAK